MKKRGRPPIDQSEKKDTRFTMRLSFTDYYRLKYAARKSGCFSIAEYIRMRAEEDARVFAKREGIDI